MPFHHWRSRDCKVKHILFKYYSKYTLAGHTVLTMDPTEYSLPYMFSSSVGIQVQTSHAIQIFFTVVEINISLCDKVYRVILES